MQFDVNDRGQLLGDFHSIRTEDRYLKVVALRLLRKALLDSFPESIRLPDRLTRLGAIFIFDLRTRQVTLTDFGVFSIVKNILSFYRQSNGGGVNFWVNESSMGRAANFDVLRLVKRYFSKEDQEDPFHPLNKFRNDPDW